MGAASELVEITPLNLTADQMQKSNPGAVEQLKAQAKAEDRQRLSALQAAFPADPAFALSAFTEGLSVEAAKVKKFDEIAPKVAALTEENTKLKGEVEAGKVTFTASDATANGSETKLEGDAGEAALKLEAGKIWLADAKIRKQFGGVQSAFMADFKHHPEDYR